MTELEYVVNDYLKNLNTLSKSPSRLFVKSRKIPIDCKNILNKRVTRKR